MRHGVLPQGHDSLWLVCGQRRFFLLRDFHLVARQIQFQNHAVVNQAIDGRGGRHRSFEDSFPFAKDEIAGQEYAPAFIALSQQSEERFHLLASLLDIADVVDDQRLVLVEPVLRQNLIRP
jgi:hypothetical protein